MEVEVINNAPRYIIKLTETEASWLENVCRMRFNYIIDATNHSNSSEITFMKDLANALKKA